MSSKWLIIILIALILFCVLIGWLTANKNPVFVLLLIGGMLCFILTIINIEIGLALLIFVIPFTRQITLTKVGGAPIDMGTDDILLLFLIFGWLGYMAKSKQIPIVRTPLNWPFAVFFIACAISLVPLSLFQSGKVVGFCWLHLLKWYEYVFIFFMVTSIAPDINQIKKYLVLFLISCGLIAGLQIFQRLTGDVTLSPFLTTKGPVSRATSSFESLGILGAYYVFLIPFAITFFLRAKNMAFKLFLVIFCMLLFYSMFTTYSRAAYVGIIPALITLGVLRKNKWILILLPLFVVLVPTVLVPSVGERASLTIIQTEPHFRLDPSADSRISMWKVGWEVYLQHPFLGIGYWATRFVVFKTTIHNQYLTILVETGILGFSLFIWLFYRIFQSAINLLRNSIQHQFLRDLGIAYLAGLVGICIHMFFGETLEASRILGPLWFMTALIISANRLCLEKRNENDKATT